MELLQHNVIPASVSSPVTLAIPLVTWPVWSTVMKPGIMRPGPCIAYSVSSLVMCSPSYCSCFPSIIRSYSPLALQHYGPKGQSPFAGDIAKETEVTISFLVRGDLGVLCVVLIRGGYRPSEVSHWTPVRVR